MWYRRRSVRESGGGGEAGGVGRGQSRRAVWGAVKSPDFDPRAQGTDEKDLSRGRARSASHSVGHLLLASDACVSASQTGFQKIRLGSADLV